jgi:cold shock CspA family protein
MGRSHETFGKKETRTKQEKKRKEKEKKRIERKENKSGSFEDMIAYVDEFGNITSTPPDPSLKKEINPEEIELGAARNTELNSEQLIRNGIVSFFDESKGFGFIKDLQNRQDVYVHANGLLEPIRENNKVTFELAKGPKGFYAVNVKISR